MRKAVNEVHGPIDWIDDPGRHIGELGLLAIARVFLADELVVGKLLLYAINEKLLHLLVSLGHEINVARLQLDSLALRISRGNELKVDKQR